jgi:hypothetical protein
VTAAVSRARWGKLRAVSNTRILRAMDRHQTGDFDDIGREHVSGAYHYQQKKCRGRLF